MYLYLYLYMYMYVYVYMYMYFYMYMHMHMHMHMYMYMYVYIYICMLVCVFIRIPKYPHAISIGKRPMFTLYRASIGRKAWAKKAGAYVQDEEGGDQARTDADV